MGGHARPSGVQAQHAGQVRPLALACGKKQQIMLRKETIKDKRDPYKAHGGTQIHKRRLL